MFQPLLSLRWCLCKMCLDVADVEKRAKTKKETHFIDGNMNFVVHVPIQR